MSDETKVSVFDRILGRLEGLPDVVSTRPAIVRYTEPVIGEVQTYTVQTWRQKDVGETIFIEYVSGIESHRFMLPPRVAAVIQRQHDALTRRNIRKGAAAAAVTRKERGIVPAFLKRK